MTGEWEDLSPEQLDHLEGLLKVARATIAEARALEAAYTARKKADAVHEEAQRRRRRRERIAQGSVLGASVLLIVAAAVINLALQYGWLGP